MSHLSLKSLEKNIVFIKKNSKIPICIDTEGAQIRSKIKKKIFKIGKILLISKNNSKVKFYPDEVKNLLKKMTN